MIDCHMHTDFSSDGTSSPQAMIESAIRKGLKFVALTDHMDMDKQGKLPDRMQDLVPYHTCLSQLQKKFAPQIAVAIGLECGYASASQHVILDRMQGLQFDYIINSIHDVNGHDVYRQSFYKGRDKKSAYGEYLEAVLESLSAVYPFHAIGHLCYPERVAPYDDPTTYYADFKDILDKIFDTIIARKLILELNSSTAKLASPCLPGRDLLTHYRARGGTRITFSSDAHDIHRIGDKYDAIVQLAASLGFTGFTYIQNGAERFERF